MLSSKYDLVSILLNVSSSLGYDWDTNLIVDVQ